MAEADDILDPAHDPGDGTENAGAAGIPSPGNDAEDKAVFSDDGNQVTRGGRTYVAQEALHNERKARQAAERTLSELDPILPELQEFMQNKRNGNQAATNRATTSDADYPDDELIGLATVRGYYAADGITPDKARAKQELVLLDQRANRAAQKHVQPLRSTSERDQATANRTSVHTQAYIDGEPLASKEHIDAVFDSLPASYAADKNIANILAVTAVGLDTLKARKAAFERGGSRLPARARSNEPMLVERGTGSFRQTDEPSEFDKAAARARGKTVEQFMKLSKQVNPRSSANQVNFEDA